MNDRFEEIRAVLLDPDHLTERGTPGGVKIQRSQFGDHRPTIFCVTKIMSDGVRKMTSTFNSESIPERTLEPCIHQM